MDVSWPCFRCNCLRRFAKRAWSVDTACSACANNAAGEDAAEAGISAATARPPASATISTTASPRYGRERDRIGLALAPRSGAVRLFLRSEEHTSELQSRGHLV